MKQFDYQISMVIEKPKDFVVKTYVDYEQFVHYHEPQFVTYNLIEGKLYEPGSVVELVYQYKTDYIILKEKWLDCDLPNSLTQLFLLGTVKNKCHSTFTEVAKGTLWHMDVKFTFPKDEGQDKLMFMRQTEGDMAAFKSYVEQL